MEKPSLWPIYQYVALVDKSTTRGQVQLLNTNQQLL